MALADSVAQKRQQSAVIQVAPLNLPSSRERACDRAGAGSPHDQAVKPFERHVESRRDTPFSIRPLRWDRPQGNLLPDLQLAVRLEYTERVFRRELPSLPRTYTFP